MSYLISNLRNIHLVVCLFYSLWACLDLNQRVHVVCLQNCWVSLFYSILDEGDIPFWFGFQFPRRSRREQHIIGT